MSSARSRPGFRVFYAVCALFVAAYVFFDILDLDGSDQPWTRQASKSAVFLVATVSEAETSWVPEWPLEHWGIANVIITYHHVVPYSYRVNEGLRIAGLTAFRRHCCRVALPRSSVPDPFAI